MSPDEFITKLKGFQNRVAVVENMVKKAATRASHISQKSKKPEPDNILASGTEKLVRDDSKSFDITITRPDGTPLTYKNLSFAGKNSRISKVAKVNWYSF